MVFVSGKTLKSAWERRITVNNMMIWRFYRHRFQILRHLGFPILACWIYCRTLWLMTIGSKWNELRVMFMIGSRIGFESINWAKLHFIFDRLHFYFANFGEGDVNSNFGLLYAPTFQIFNQPLRLNGFLFSEFWCLGSYFIASMSHSRLINGVWGTACIQVSTEVEEEDLKSVPLK